jgi:AraC-like DNA-binding protein
MDRRTRSAPDAGCAPPRPDPYTVLDSSDPVHVEGFVSSQFGLRIVEHVYAPGSYHAQIGRIGLGPVDIIYSTSTGCGRYVAPADALVRLQWGLSGRTYTRVGKARLQHRGDGAVVTPAYADLEQYVDEPEHIIITVREAELRRKLAVLLGSDLAAPVEFAAAADLDHPNIRLLRHSAGRFLLDAQMGVAEVSPLVQAEVAQSWLAALLYGAAHTHSRLLAADPADAGLPAVRRAADYVESNWNKPLLIEDIAAAVGVGASSLFKTFKALRGVSPMAYVRRVRLDKAHAMLLAADRSAAVADIALTCGFSNGGHFARDYRKAFGERPSDTVARARAIRRLRGHRA